MNFSTFACLLVASVAGIGLISAQSIDVFEVGPVVNVQHNVSGYLYAFNQSLLILDGFTFDGQGIGVFFKVGK